MDDFTVETLYGRLYMETLVGRLYTETLHGKFTRYALRGPPIVRFILCDQE